MTKSDYTTPTDIRQHYLATQARLDRRVNGAIGTGMNDNQARQFVHKLTLERVANLSRLREAIHDLIAGRYDYHVALSGYLADALAGAVSDGQIKDDLRSIGQYWLDVLAQVEDGTLLERIVDDSDYQARVEAQILGERACDLVRERYGDQADAKLDEICERLDDPAIPDTIPAIIEFWRTIIAENQPAPQPPTPSPRPPTLYDLARQAVEERAAQFPDETITIYRGHGLRVRVYRSQYRILMDAVNGDPRKAERVEIGFLGHAGWTFSLDRFKYKNWVRKAKRLAQ